jgi:hypothetical protein
MRNMNRQPNEIGWSENVMFSLVSKLNLTQLNVYSGDDGSKLILKLEDLTFLMLLKLIRELSKT